MHNLFCNNTKQFRLVAYVLPHTLMQYMMYGRKREWYNIRIPHLSMAKLVLYIMAQLLLLESLDFIIEMCFFHVNLLSIKTPTYFVNSTLLISSLLICIETCL